MRKVFKKLMLSCVVLLLSLAAFSQNAVTGKVTDAKDGTPVAGATITVKGTRTAVQSAADGSFSINAATNATLVISSVGFAQREVSANAAASIGLTQVNQQLNELVVVAYGTRRK